MRIGSLWAMAGAARPDVSDTMPAAEPAMTVRRLIDMSFPPDVFMKLAHFAAPACGEPIAPGRPWSMRTALRSQAEPLRGFQFQFRRQSPQDFVDDLGRRPADIDADRPFFQRRLLQGGELVVEQCGRHEVALSRGHAPADQFARALEMDQTDIGP